MRAFRTTSGQKFVARAARRLTLMAAAWSTLLACADLEKLDADVCGNGVVEKDEDCEVARDIDGTCGEPGTAVACFYVCDDQTACPSGWSCGAEGVCYQGNGSFYLGAQVPFVGDRAELGDFTADGYDDLAIAADDIIRFRFGPFIETELSESVAGNRGFAAADINGDGADDGVIGSPDSWYILLGSPDLSVGSSFHPSASLGLG
ncbi:MAG: VCBS repeat-containing protein, partial [Deltaproteobacteria bacterium]|nr:VCBS repeat-containing protein [Deltaproteobacteria bacterium]